MLQKIRESLQIKLIIPIVLGTVIAVAVAVGYLFRVKAQNTELAGITTARAVTNQITTLRTFYTKEVVARAKTSKMNINYDFTGKTDTLPLPATLVNVLGQQIEQDYPGTKVRLYSEYPFPHRIEEMKKASRWNEKGFKDGLDTFERDALESLKTNPTEPFFRLEDVDGKLSMRYAVSDRMRTACLQCHNSHPESPKKDWKEGELRGVVSVVVPVDQAEAGLKQGAIAVAGMVAGCSVVLGIAIYLVIHCWVLRPVKAFENTFTNIAMGDFHSRVPVNTSDEIGRMSSNFNAMLDNVVVPLFEDRTAERDSAPV